MLKLFDFSHALSLRNTPNRAYLVFIIRAASLLSFADAELRKYG